VLNLDESPTVVDRSIKKMDPKIMKIHHEAMLE